MIRPEPNEASKKRTENTDRFTPEAMTARDEEKRSSPRIIVVLFPYLPATLPDAKTPTPTTPTETETIAPMTESLMLYALSILGTTMPTENLKRP